MSSAAVVAVEEELRPDRRMTWVYSLTIFLAAFLLFQVELILSAYVLPWFGGSAAVWTTAMLLFQTLLFAAYAYAHKIAVRFIARHQVRLHLALIVVSVMALVAAAMRWPSPILPATNWKPTDINHPVLDLVSILLASIGAPFFLLATSGPLLQAWYVRATARSPYHLYAISNLGSLLGLLSYPVMVEPLLKLRTQGWWWSGLYVVFALGVMTCATVARSRAGSSKDMVSETKPETARPGTSRFVLWIVLPACASVALLATTGVISLYLASMPLIWVLPLSVYLISFIVCFGPRRWYVPGLFHALYGMGGVVLLVAIATTDVWFELGVCLFLLFAICMICHGEVARLKPPPEHATGYYLCISGGGALGGVFVGVIAPLLFSGMWEFQFVIVATGLLVLVGLCRQRDSWLYRSPRIAAVVTVTLFAILPYAAMGCNSNIASTFKQMGYFSSGAILCIPLIPIFGVSLIKPKDSHSRAATLGLLLMALVLLGFSLYRVPWGKNGVTVARSRNFYGVLEVQQSPTETLLMHGKTLHGGQSRVPYLRQKPITYYAPESGFGQFMLSHPKRNPVSPMKIGVIGMGTGTIAAYGLPGDSIRFYELNPGVDEVVRGDKAWFSFINESQAKVDVVLGDGRLSLERELLQGRAQNFDLLILDAFNGDAIPVHLLTAEAFDTYLQHIARDGVLVMHISSSTLDLSPVLVGLMKRTGLFSTMLYSADKATGISSIWVLFSHDPEMLKTPGVRRIGQPLDRGQTPVYWTDDHADVVRLLYH